MTTAFVLGGGGVLGAVEVGMLRALFERGIRPDLVLGTSIGAFNGALVASQPEPAVVGRKYWVRHGNRWVQARIAAIESRLDIHTLEATDAHELAVNDIGHVVVETQAPLPIESYETNRVGGALIVVDPTTNRTSGALLVKAAA